MVFFLALLVRLFVLSSFRVSSAAMMPQFFPGDYILSLRSAYGITLPFSGMQVGQKVPKRGDVVILRSPEDESLTYVARIIGVPGDRLEMRANALSVNNELADYRAVQSRSFNQSNKIEVIEEQFSWGKQLVLLDSSKTQSFGPVIVPPGQLFVLGDYRQKSFDSRYFGSVPQANIEGRVIMIWFSLDWSETKSQDTAAKVRWKRMGRLTTGEKL